MLVVYSSKTGNVERFVKKLGIKSINIKDINYKINEPFVLVTYTDGFGEVPKEVENFLKNNNDNLIAVGASGNRNWANKFALSANKISHKYNVPILLKFELSGDKKDVEIFLERMRQVYEAYKKIYRAK